MRLWLEMFDFVNFEINQACGNGDGIIVFHLPENVQKAAKLFEQWREMRQPKGWMAYSVRHDISPNHILFSDGSNENLILVSKDESEKARPAWTPEVYLEVW